MGCISKTHHRGNDRFESVGIVYYANRGTIGAETGVHLNGEVRGKNSASLGATKTFLVPALKGVNQSAIVAISEMVD